MKIYIQSTYGIIIAFVGYVLNLAASIIVARWLHAAKYGDFSVVISMSSLACILALMGRDKIVLHHLPIYYQQKKFALIRGYLICNTKVSFLSGIVLNVIGLMIWLILYHTTTNFVVHSLLIGLPLIPLMATVNYSSNVLIATHFTIASYFILEVILPIMLVVFIFLLRSVLQEVNVYEALYAANLTWGFLLLCFFVFIYFKILSPLGSKRDYRCRDSFGFGLPFLISNLSLMTLQELTLIILELLNVPENKIGIYAAVDHITYLNVLVSGIVIEMMLPPIFRLINKSHPSTLKKYLKSIFYVNSFLGVIFLFLAFVFGKTILSWFGKDFLGGYSLLCFMIVGYMFNLMLGISIPLLQFAKLHEFVILSYVIMFIATIILCFTLIPIFSVMGGAIAVIVPYAMMLIYLTFIVWKKMRITLWGNES